MLFHAPSAKMEMWFPILEKAYAAYKGSYNEIGSGGLSSDVFEHFVGTDLRRQHRMTP